MKHQHQQQRYKGKTLTSINEKWGTTEPNGRVTIKIVKQNQNFWEWYYFFPGYYLTKLENEQGLTLKKLAEDCQRVVSVKSDFKTVEESGVAHNKKRSRANRHSILPSEKEENL